MRSAIVVGVSALATPVLGLAVLAGAEGGSAGASSAAVASQICRTVGPVPGLDATQAAHGRTIVSVAQQVTAGAGFDTPSQSRAELIALMTAYTESTLHNYANPKVPASEQLTSDGNPPNGGDHDSVGLFQQRASWGSLTDRMNPSAATTLFVQRLLGLAGWTAIPPGVAAQAVQMSAYPGRYAANQARAAAWLAAIQGTAPQPPSGGGRASVMLECDGDGLGTKTGPVAPGKLPTGYQIPANANDPERTAITFALAQLGKPYVFGATGPDAYDCSGLTMAAWAAAGVQLAHYTGTQFHEGSPVAGIALLRPGDLILIPGSDGTLHPPNPHHVGMYIGEHYVIEAPQTGEVVKIVPLADFGPIVGIRHIA